MTIFPEKVLDDDMPTYLKALIAAYEDHIKTLRDRIKELEGLREPIGPMIHPARNLEINTTPRPVIRTSSQIRQEMERRSALNMNKEVKEEDVK